MGDNDDGSEHVHCPKQSPDSRPPGSTGERVTQWPRLTQSRRNYDQRERPAKKGDVAATAGPPTNPRSTALMLNCTGKATPATNANNKRSQVTPFDLPIPPSFSCLGIRPYQVRSRRARGRCCLLPYPATCFLTAKRVSTPPFWVSRLTWSATQKVIAWMVSVGL
jgi:hypothetical protein